ncbi:ATP-binding protein [Coxiella-like endosymbiont of Rhipicephalus sanguineus]|uniref:ATP-binding protein n=1 Tax=Coxiella-like endosymbiont of Rhipicephalus sanguineus TaxID=1955402 RepID=UPI00255A9D6A|nr:ATP-binding protein [Coxiella-like endosymbiont of Rhipicephalus sanguineus]
MTVGYLCRSTRKITVCFTVEDTGMEIEKSNLSSISNRFQQVNSVYHRKYEGVGLGLSIVKEFVEKIGSILLT